MASVNRLTSDKADKDLWQKRRDCGACVFQSRRMMHDGRNDFLAEYQNYVFNFYFSFYLFGS
jgi:hypothetical protein